MRSRYSAYAKALIDYIIDTTHPDSQKEVMAQREEIEQFARETSFDGLEILEIQEGKEEAFVTFKAILHQGSVDVTFTEKSRFEKLGGKWYYHSGEIEKGEK